MDDTILKRFKVACVISFLVLLIFIYFIITQTGDSENNKIVSIVSFIIFIITASIVGYHSHKKHEEKRNIIFANKKEEIASMY